MHPSILKISGSAGIVFLINFFRFAEDFQKHFKDDLNRVYPAEDQKWLINNLKEEVSLSSDMDMKEITKKSLIGVYNVHILIRNNRYWPCYVFPFLIILCLVRFLTNLPTCKYKLHVQEILLAKKLSDPSNWLKQMKILWSMALACIFTITGYTVNVKPHFTKQICLYVYIVFKKYWKNCCHGWRKKISQFCVI